VQELTHCVNDSASFPMCIITLYISHIQCTDRSQVCWGYLASLQTYCAANSVQLLSSTFVSLLLFQR
jgi:hypothetical protein